MLVARNAEQLAETEADIRALNEQVEVLSVPTDLASEESVARLFDQVKARFGTVDVLINNAGTSNDGRMVDVEFKNWWTDFVRFFAFRSNGGAALPEPRAG